MNVVALGCGEVGRFAIETALGFDFVEQVIIADRNGAAAAQLASTCGSRASSVELDVTETAKLVEVLRPADVVLSTVGPYFRFGLPILEAAIEAGTHYIDICDDWEPTLTMLELDQRARKAGITAVLGLGASPGVTNLLAVRAAEELDSVDSLYTGWMISGEPEEMSEFQGRSNNAALEHWMHQCSGQIRLLQGGEFVMQQPIQKRQLPFPGVGNITAWTVGHPEAITLPRRFPELTVCANLMVGSRLLIEFVRYLASRVDRGELTDAEAAQELARPPRNPLERGVSKLFAHWVSAGPEWAWLKKDRLSTVFAYAEGTRAGQPTRVGARVTSMPSGSMGGATGVPLAVGLVLLANQSLTKRGVFAPEEGIDPTLFFDALAPLCAPSCQNSSELLKISVV